MTFKKKGGDVFSSISEMTTWLVIGWAIWPGSFFLLALIGESRMPPLWKNQSKAFFPGDLTLPVIWIAMFRLNKDTPVSPSAFVTLFIIEAVIFWVVTKIAVEDRKNYPSKSANSPTKIYHDLVGYYVFPLSVAPLCVSYAANLIENHAWPSRSLLWVVVPLISYISCVMYDIHKGFTTEDIEARHPSDWKPIWK